METNWYSDTTAHVTAMCECPDHTGRELRLWTGLAHLEAIRTDATALHNAAVTAARMPFAFTANQGVVFADKVA